MLNHFKISRTAKGLGIGFFNAITKKHTQLLKTLLVWRNFRKLIEPLSNYNLLVLDQVLKNNSYITLQTPMLLDKETLKMLTENFKSK